MAEELKKQWYVVSSSVILVTVNKNDFQISLNDKNTMKLSAIRRQNS